ncbi:MAG: ankyrin repeat domain-containing protein [Janthinobacterium lividum]
MVTLLIDAGADMNALGGMDSGSALHKAARDQHIDMVKLLLDRGTDPNIEDMDGDTVSYLQHFFSAQRPPEKTLQILELLKEFGATSSQRQERLLNSNSSDN